MSDQQTSAPSPPAPESIEEERVKLALAEAWANTREVRERELRGERLSAEVRGLVMR